MIETPGWWEKTNPKNYTSWKLTNLLDYKNSKDLKEFFENCDEDKQEKFVEELIYKLWWIKDKEIHEEIKENLWETIEKIDVYYANRIIEILNLIKKFDKINFGYCIQSFIQDHKKEKDKDYDIRWIEAILSAIKCLEKNWKYDYKVMDCIYRYNLTYWRFFNKTEPKKLSLIEKQGTDYMDKVEDRNLLADFVSKKIMKQLWDFKNQKIINWFHHFFRNWTSAFALWNPWSTNNLSNIINFIEKWENIKELLEFSNKLHDWMEHDSKEMKEEDKILWKWLWDILSWTIGFIREEQTKNNININSEELIKVAILIWIANYLKEAREQNDGKIKYNKKEIIEKIIFEQLYLKILSNEEWNEEEIEKIMNSLWKEKRDKFLRYITYKTNIEENVDWFNHYYFNGISKASITKNDIKYLKKIMKFWDKWEKVSQFWRYSQLFKYVNSFGSNTWIELPNYIETKEMEKIRNKIEKWEKDVMLWNGLETLSWIIYFIESWNEKFDYEKIEEKINKYIKKTI